VSGITILSRKLKSALFTLVLAFVLTACALVRPQAVPQPEIGAAEIPGIPHARIWGDQTPPPEFMEWLGGYIRDSEVRSGDHFSSQLHVHYLALSGGGGDGAFGAGLLNGWSAAGTRPVFRVVTGVSTGALIAPFAYLGPNYDDLLRDLYTGVNLSGLLSVTSLWRLLFSESLADTTPVAKLIAKHVNESVMQAIANEYSEGRLLLIATTNLDAQRPVLWNIGEIASSGQPHALELIQKIILASTSIPGAFPPVYIEVEANGKRYHEMHVDGGTTTQVFLYPAALDTRKLLSTHRPRTAYVVRNGRIGPEWIETTPGFSTVAQRSISTMIKSQAAGDLYRIYLGSQRDGIDYNCAFIGDDFVAERKDEFDQGYMRALYEYGFNAGKSGYRWQKAPPGFEPPVVEKGGSQYRGIPLPARTTP
jgi:hypothetical protein